MKRHRVIVTILLLIVALVTVSISQAQDGEVTDDEVNAIAKKLYCPVCENIPLDVCPTQACADWRGEIRTMLEEGRTEDEILAYFSNRYGERVLATPEKEGFNLILWVLPPLGVVLGGGVLIMALRRMAPAAKAAPAGVRVSYDDLDAEYVARLESDLQEL